MKKDLPIGLRTPTVPELFHGTVIDGVKLGKNIATKVIQTTYGILGVSRRAGRSGKSRRNNKKP